VGVTELEGQELLGRGGLECAGLFGGTDELDAERARGVEEVLRPVGPGRKEKQQPVDD
jgi:hypothetical protein